MIHWAALVILGLGALGYAIAFVFVARLRWWMWRRRRGQGWPNILLNAIIFLLLLLFLLFAVSLANTLGLTRQLPFSEKVAIAFLTAGALGIAPWGLIWALWLWWRRQIVGGEA